MDVDDQIKETAVGQLDVYNGLPKSIGRMKVKMETDQEGRRHLKKVRDSVVNLSFFLSSTVLLLVQHWIILIK